MSSISSTLNFATECIDAIHSTSRTVNSDWFNNAGPDSSEQTAMKDALRVGGVADLNVYTVGYVARQPHAKIFFLMSSISFTSGSGAGLLGYSTFPYSYSGAPQDDGVVMLFSSTPGGSTADYNLGQVSFTEVFFNRSETDCMPTDAHSRGWALGRPLPSLPRWLLRFWRFRFGHSS